MHAHRLAKEKVEVDFFNHHIVFVSVKISSGFHGDCVEIL
jgi:hypothetical protein